MNEIKVKDIIKICNAKLLTGNMEDTIDNFKKDTREIKANDTYFGIQGEKVNRKYILRKSF